MEGRGRKKKIRALGTVLLLYVGWMIVTYVLEGSRSTLLRPEATALRVLYSTVANMAIGVAGGIWLLRRMLREGFVSRHDAGFGSWRRSITWLPIGLILGFGLYAIQGAPSWDPIIILNAFSQVLVVSAAEVVVCWALVGTALFESMRKNPPDEGVLHETAYVHAAAISGAAILFGVYHFAHSPPFNTVSMVLLLSVVGVATGSFFFISRDIYGTLAFHNLLGVFGVITVLEANNSLPAFRQIHWPLVIMAVVTTLLLVAGHLWIRRESIDGNIIWDG